VILDTSAIIAILTGEPERDAFTAAIAADEVRLTSVVSVVEAGIVIEARYRPDGGADLDLWLRAAAVRVAPFDLAQAALSRESWRLFGKGRHPAGLNLGDCCVYALAKSTEQPVLCKGQDFSRTDILIVRL